MQRGLSAGRGPRWRGALGLTTALIAGFAGWFCSAWTAHADDPQGLRDARYRLVQEMGGPQWVRTLEVHKHLPPAGCGGVSDGTCDTISNCGTVGRGLVITQYPTQPPLVLQAMGATQETFYFDNYSFSTRYIISLQRTIGYVCTKDGQTTGKDVTVEEGRWQAQVEQALATATQSVDSRLDPR